MLQHCRQIFIVATLAMTPAWSCAKEMILTPADDPIVGELEPVLIKLLDGSEPDLAYRDIYQDRALQGLIAKHDLKLFSGPMLGCVTPTSARFWLRASEPAKVRVVVQAVGDAAQFKSSTGQITVSNDLTGLFDVSGLQANTHYVYNVLINGEPQFKTLPQFRTAPAKGAGKRIDIAFGGGARYIPAKERIWDTIAGRQPAAFLALGDNLYIDLPMKRNMQNLYYYRRLLRPEFRRLISTTPIYSIWDDHDFGDNDCEGGAETFKPSWKVKVWEVFRNNWNNPGYGGGTQQPGCWYDFSIGDIDFFMTDGRYYRSREAGQMLGPVQMEVLLDKLAASQAVFKGIASGTLWTEFADKGGRDSWWGFPEERERLLGFIEQKRIEGVVLISADRHRSEVFKIARPNGYAFYEFESSKLTNDHTHGPNKKSLISFNKGNFFGLLTFDFTLDDPAVTFRCITSDDEETQQFTVYRSDLSY